MHNIVELDNPQKLIQSISCARTSHKTLDAKELAFLKKQLLLSEENPKIIRAARGDGRQEFLKNIVSDDKIIFNWGVKSQHAFHRKSNLRDFLEPESSDLVQMGKIKKSYYRALVRRFQRDFHLDKSVLDGIMTYLDREIEAHKDSPAVLFAIKNWISSVLQTSGDIDFRNISPWISASVGNTRFATAHHFGSGEHSQIEHNSKFVILDTWVYAAEEHKTFEYTSNLINTFNQFGLPWYPDTHSEIVLKYAIFPQRLVGYYYFENNNLCYYYVNPHYLDEWSEHPGFQIGDPLYINQEDVCFPANIPYKLI